MRQAAQKRERNAKDAKGDAKSQLKVNEMAKNKKCGICMATFLQTTNKKVSCDANRFYSFVSAKG